MNTKKGIDISYHQGTVNFKKVKADGIEFVILRSSYGQVVDKKFHSYVLGCKKFKLPIFGVYHFIYALNNDGALANAKYCVEQVEKAGLGKDIYIFCDYEYDTVRYAKDKGVMLTKKECNQFTKTFCQYVASKGYKTGIYTNNDYYKNVYNKDIWSKYPLWLADYSGGPDRPCMIQQISSKGSVSGINGYVDMNIIFEEESDEKIELKDITTVANEVIEGKWGNGEVRKSALEKAGYDYTEVQTMVNKLLAGTKSTSKKITATNYAKSFDKVIAGTYKTTCDLYMRNGAGERYKALCLIPADTKVQCYGYYTEVDGRIWLYIQVTSNKTHYTGFARATYLKK